MPRLLSLRDPVVILSRAKATFRTNLELSLKVLSLGSTS
jgi:hypothetical protein